MGRDANKQWLELIYKRFNPRARVGRDLIEIRTGAGESVSIHAPAWGATTVVEMGDAWTGVSIHAPAWGAT